MEAIEHSAKRNDDPSVWCTLFNDFEEYIGEAVEVVKNDYEQLSNNRFLNFELAHSS